MNSKKILVQKISAIEAMSHLTTLCLDKTGTLGTNNLKFRALKILTTIANKTEIERKLRIFIDGISDKNKTIHALLQEYKDLDLINKFFELFRLYICIVA